jgi:hypothetical protein
MVSAKAQSLAYTHTGHLRCHGFRCREVDIRPQIRAAPRDRTLGGHPPANTLCFLRCWTEDHLAKRNLPHPAACVHCDQDGETIQHVLISCVYAREVWHAVLRKIGLGPVVPQPTKTRFSSWWCAAVKQVPKEMRKGFNSFSS